MKRYTLKQTVTVYRDPLVFDQRIDSVGHMVESTSGEWVSAEDAEAAIRELGPKLPESRIDRLEKALGLFEEGRCPECECAVRNWKPPVGSFAPEQWETLKERGIDPGTGHRITCSRANK